jgi:predicted amino acid-binding ACT domain protein
MTAMLVVVAVPEQVDRDALKAALTRAVPGLDVMRLWVEPIDDMPPQEPERCYLITATGQDRPGIVHGFSAAFADLGIRMLDLSSQRLTPPANADGSPPGPTYGLSITVSLPPDLTPESLEASMRTVAEDFGLDLSVDESRALM